MTKRTSLLNKIGLTATCGLYALSSCLYNPARAEEQPYPSYEQTKPQIAKCIERISNWLKTTTKERLKERGLTGSAQPNSQGEQDYFVMTRSQKDRSFSLGLKIREDKPQTLEYMGNLTGKYDEKGKIVQDYPSVIKDTMYNDGEGLTIGDYAVLAKKEGSEENTERVRILSDTDSKLINRMNAMYLEILEAIEVELGTSEKKSP
jgi:hypothetical protein